MQALKLALFSAIKACTKKEVISLPKQQSCEKKVSALKDWEVKCGRQEMAAMILMSKPIVVIKFISINITTYTFLTQNF